MRVVVTGIGVACALGEDPGGLAAGVRDGLSGLTRPAALDPLPDSAAGVVTGPSLKGYLLRRKDAKLLARPSELALPPAARALAGWPGDRAELGLFFGVGREPPDQGEAEASLAAAARGGVLDEALLAGPGRDLYPPLLPLKTRPNMALAHVSINLGACGENGAWAGGVGAGWMALDAAWWALVEGRAPAALAGGADSGVDLGSARDRLREGATGAPGEAGVALRIEPEAAAIARGVAPLGWIEPLSPEAAAGAVDVGPSLRRSIGDCGAAEAGLCVLVALLGGLGPAPEGGFLLAGRDPGQPAAGFRVVPTGAAVLTSGGLLQRSEFPRVES